MESLPVPSRCYATHCIECCLAHEPVECGRSLSAIIIIARVQNGSRSRSFTREIPAPHRWGTSRPHRWGTFSGSRLPHGRGSFRLPLFSQRPHCIRDRDLAPPVMQQPARSRWTGHTIPLEVAMLAQLLKAIPDGLRCHPLASTDALPARPCCEGLWVHVFRNVGQDPQVPSC